MIEKGSLKLEGMKIAGMGEMKRNGNCGRERSEAEMKKDGGGKKKIFVNIR